MVRAPATSTWISSEFVVNLSPYPFHSWAQNVHSPNLPNRECVCYVLSIIIFHLSKLWKAKFFILCNVNFWWKFRANLKLITLRSERVKARLHMWFVMRFLMRFCEASRGLERKFSHYLKTPFFPISANLAVFCRSVTRLKSRTGRLGWGRFCTQNRTKIASNRLRSKLSDPSSTPWDVRITCAPHDQRTTCWDYSNTRASLLGRVQGPG